MKAIGTLIVIVLVIGVALGTASWFLPELITINGKSYTVRDYIDGAKSQPKEKEGKGKTPDDKGAVPGVPPEGTEGSGDKTKSPSDAGLPGAPSGSGRRKALLVGIDDYGNPQLNLSGCLNDVKAIKNLLKSVYGFEEGDIVTLTDSQASAKGIIAAFEKHVIGAAEDAAVLFYYSGHGTMVFDKSGDEAARDPSDLEDEALAPYGANFYKPETLLLDDTIESLTKRVKSKRFLMMVDSCHSGSVNKAMASAQALRGRNWVSKLLLPPKDLIPQAKSGGIGVPAPPKKSRESWVGGESPFPVLTACQPEQVAYVMTEKNPPQSALTGFVVDFLGKAENKDVTLKKLMETLAPKIEKWSEDTQKPNYQTPWSAGDLDKSVRYFLDPDYDG